MSIGMSPFRALYNYDPLTFVEIVFGNSRAPMVQDWIQQSQDILKELKGRLQRAHNQQKVQANKHRVERTFEVGDLVSLSLQPFDKSEVVKKTNTPDQENTGMAGLAMTPPSVKEFWAVVEKKKKTPLATQPMVTRSRSRNPT